MERLINLLELAIPFLHPYGTWVKILVSVWILLTATVIISFLFASRSPMKTEYWQMTGDVRIDTVLTKLNDLQAKGPFNESKLLSTLSPLFTRPAFYDVREDDWGYFLYALCKTRLILEHYLYNFKSSPKVKTGIDSVIQQMVKLQYDVGPIYGPAFKTTKHIDNFIHNKDTFIMELPGMVGEPTMEFIEERNKTIKEMRSTLKRIGLITSEAPVF